MVEAAGTDPCDSMSVDQIKTYLCEMAERHIANQGNYSSHKTDASMELQVNLSEEGGIHLSVIKVKGAGLSMDDIRAWLNPEVFFENMKILDSVLTCQKLGDNIGEGSYALF